MSEHYSKDIRPATANAQPAEPHKFLRRTWYVAAWGREIVAGQALGRTICNERIVLFRGADGAVAALEDRCSHRGLPLSCGQVISGEIQCGYHGMVFSANGSCLRIPGQALIPRHADVVRYAVIEKDELVWIWMGSAADADTSAIPDFPWHNDSVNWPHKSSMCPIMSNYLLVVDNLMDLSHLGFVHTKTIGGNAADHVNARTTVERTPTGVRFSRLMFDAVPPATYTKGVPFKGRIDRWQEFELVAPSCILQWAGGIDAGKGAEDPAKRVGGVQIRIFHGITPETDSTSFYFWSAANGHCAGDPGVTERLYQDVDFTIKEDAFVLAEQQKNLARYPDRNYVTIQSDNARLLARRHLEQRIAQERAAAAG